VPNGYRSGIMAGHAYGIIDVFEIPDQEMRNIRKTHRILRVRNPYGHGEWTGKWSS
jgi:calpain, invertebrate